MSQDWIKRFLSSDAARLNPTQAAIILRRFEAGQANQGVGVRADSLVPPSPGSSDKPLSSDAE